MPAAGSSTPLAKEKLQRRSRSVAYLVASVRLRPRWRCAVDWLRWLVLESTLLLAPWADPAPPRPSRAVGPFGSRGRACSRAGKLHRPRSHVARGGDRPRRLFGQSRPNPTHASSLRTANHFPGTPASLPRHFALVRGIPRGRWERRLGEAGGGRRGVADAESLSSHLRRRRHSGASKGRRAGRPQGSKITSGKFRAGRGDSFVLAATSSRNWGWLYR